MRSASVAVTTGRPADLSVILSWVVMEYMEGGALTDIIENNALEEDQISSICFEVNLLVFLLDITRTKDDLIDLQGSWPPPQSEHHPS